MGMISVSLAATTVTLDDGTAALTASVTNGEPSTQRVVLGVYASPAAASGPTGGAAADPRAWVTVDRALRQVGPGATEQYTLTMTRAAAPVGTHQLKVIAYPADSAPEEYSDQGQTLTVTVPPQPEPEPPKRPWWILVLIAVILLVIGGIVFWLTRPPAAVAVPDVAGLTQGDARARLVDAGITGTVSTATVHAPRTPQDVAVGTDPPADAEVPPGDAVLLVLGSGLVEVPDDLVGLSDTDAAAALEELGLTVAFSGARPGTVNAINPTGLVPVDQTVTLSITPDEPQPPLCQPWPQCILGDLPILEIPDRVFELPRDFAPIQP